MRIKPVKVWIWEKPAKMRFLQKSLNLKGYTTDSVHDQLLDALGKGTPPPPPANPILKVDISIDYKAVTEQYISYFDTKEKADQFWIDWRNIENQLGNGPNLLSCSGTSHENSGG